MKTIIKTVEINGELYDAIKLPYRGPMYKLIPLSDCVKCAFERDECDDYCYDSTQDIYTCDYFKRHEEHS